MHKSRRLFNKLLTGVSCRMSQPVQQVVSGQVVQGQMVQVQGQVGQVVSGTQVVNSAGQVVMTTTSGLTTLGGQQLMTQLVPGQAMQGQVVHQAPAAIGHGATATTGLTQGQIMNAQTVTGVQQVVQGQQIQTVNHQVAQPTMVAAATAAAPAPTPQPTATPTATTVKATGPNQAVPAPTASNNATADTTAPVLNKQRITELVREVDPNEQLEEEVEEMLLAIADDFIESTVNAACRLAKHRGARSLDVKDVQMYLERKLHMWLPALEQMSSTLQKGTDTEAHKQRLALIRKQLRILSFNCENQCFKKQVKGKVSFCGCPNHFRLVTVTSGNQAKALPTLTIFTGKPIPAEPHPTLNTCIRTVSISPTNCPVYDKKWSDCKEDLLACFMDYHAVSVQCYITPPRNPYKNTTNIAKITFRRQDLPFNFYIGGESLSNHINHITFPLVPLISPSHILLPF
ncbi:transcription initiation factor TFIID subunit 12b-like [Penaeus monodon]|uniref:transcription initiation factor TFIID subunit 12b-like n=1 Tax=Penaeus monodon TaxID=6687 RepID=UPI0018A75949|nr:transcription initiation factor TFIID subunit 12b-like [Penaeus monodon]